MIEHRQKLVHAIEHEWPRKRVLVVGDVMLDKYLWGDVKRISPEAPVPVVLASHETCQPGGAANVAMNLVRLGAEAHVCGFVGDDEAGRTLAELLRRNGIASSLVVSPDFPTTSKLRILGGGQQMLRIDSERHGARPDDERRQLLDHALDGLSSCDAVVLSDYAKGTLSPQVCRVLIDAARRRGLPVIVDPKSTDFSRYVGATTVCPNLAELAAALHEDGHDLHRLLTAAQSMVEQYDLEFLTATLSEKGIALIRPLGHSIAPAASRAVFDVSGAGDTVIAVLALCLSCGIAPDQAVRLANLAAGIVVGKTGTAPVDKPELLAALAHEASLPDRQKLMSLDDVAAQVAQWRMNGERIVFTNGCFDLLHVGHTTLLEQARRFGDRLIVALNSDVSVRVLKGPGRPIVAERDRAHVLAALASVDAVVLFDEQTPLSLIRAIRPDVLVKGGDYTPETVVGAKEVASWGGQLRIIPLVEGASTTQLIKTMEMSGSSADPAACSS
ncbi:MAG: bifunctional D-glycero-beta-D-manno-heptose-7-phosphate kinase/D-glycero-beta-D-manno-heptose 1-phosphate adenylyltransferase HldE [Terracidiphilus sp.]